MAKNIVFCADGTWDGAGSDDHVPSPDPSNVLKTFDALAGALTLGTSTGAEQERTLPDNGGGVTQVGKYLHGVGNSDNWLVQKLGGGLGAGLIGRVLRGYTFLSRQYRVGDRIALIGFSRGAYTVRALSGLVATLGLLDWQALQLNPVASDPRGYEFAAAAWYQWQRIRHANARSPNWLVHLQLLIADLPELMPWLLHSPRYVANVPIDSIAVWETVGALGIPELSHDDGARLDLLRFVDTALSANVRRGVQAVAADEQRIDFTPTLWDSDPQRVLQCLFAGAHADLGGGYAIGEQSQLSDIALQWMTEQLSSLGIIFAQQPQAPAGAALGPLHKPWTSPMFSLRPNGPRELPRFDNAARRLQVHDALAQRLGRLTPAVTDTAPPITRQVPYLPLALADAGYLNIPSITLKS